MLAKRYVITANTSSMTGTYAGTRIVPSAAVSPTSRRALRPTHRVPGRLGATWGQLGRGRGSG